MSTIKKTIDTDGDFAYKLADWNGPSGYSIVVPAENEAAKKAAQKLQAFFIRQMDVSLIIVDDCSVETAKEVLIGNTNRAESNKNMAESELSVAVKGEKLVFEGGHDVTVGVAVDKFIRLSPKNNQAVTFNITTDFCSKMPGGYEYVWGDEFEGDDIDFSKWSFDHSMAGSDTIILSCDKDVATCEDGRLKLHAYKCSESEEGDFRIPYCLSSAFNMNYTYGYAEIRARVPACKGAFPAWWAKTTSLLGGRRNSDYMAEIDIFEAFEDEVRCTLHKWYKGLDFDGTYGLPYNQHTDLNCKMYRGDLNLTYKADSYKFFSEEYHTYGFEWTPEYVAMSVDGEVYSKIDITKSYDENPDPSGFHDTIFLIFDNFVLDKSSSMTNATIYEALDELPTCFYVDYIRLYQKPGVGVLNLSDTNNADKFPTRK